MFVFVSFENEEDDNANGDHQRWYSYDDHADVRSERAREGTVLGARVEELGDGDERVGDTPSDPVSSTEAEEWGRWEPEPEPEPEPEEGDGPSEDGDVEEERVGGGGARSGSEKSTGYEESGTRWWWWVEWGSGKRLLPLPHA